MDHGGLTRSRGGRLRGERHQLGSMEARGDRMKPLRCDSPIGITARTAQQIELPRGAFGKGGSQFTLQDDIVARRTCQRSIEPG